MARHIFAHFNVFIKYLSHLCLNVKESDKQIKGTNGDVEQNTDVNLRGLSQKGVDFCYNTRLCIRKSLKFEWYFYIHHIDILHKCGWNHSLNNKIMNLYLIVCRRVRNTLKFKNKIHLVQILVFIQLKFAVLSHTILLPLQSGTIQGKVF